MSGQPGPEIREVANRDELPAALAALGLGGERPVLVSVGGAGGLDDAHLDALGGLLRAHVVPVLHRLGVLVVDGGTDSGVMKAMGEAARGTGIVLLGVAAAGTVVRPGSVPPPGSRSDAAALDPHHRAVLLVPGSQWGEESPWIAAVATIAAGTRPSATLVVNGGEVTYDDARESVEAGRPLVVVAGTGRAADEIARAARGADADPRAAALAASGLVEVLELDAGARAGDALTRLLSA